MKFNLREAAIQKLKDKIGNSGLAVRLTAIFTNG